MPVAYKEPIRMNQGYNDASKFNLEVGRLESFNKSWPHPENCGCSGTKMAQAGFYYTGKNDCVRCFVCRIRLEEWVPTEDEPWQKHAEASPNCQFARIRKKEGDLTLDQWIDMFCDQAKHSLESRLKHLNT